MNPTAPASQATFPSRSTSCVHWGTRQSVRKASFPAHLAFVPMGWCPVPVYCLDVAEVNTNRLGWCKQPTCVPTLWHSCLAQKKNKAGKANIGNTAGSLSGSILLPIIFPDVLNSTSMKKSEAKTQPLNARLYLHSTSHGVSEPCKSGQEISPSESQPHTQKIRQSFLLHCSAAKEKLKIDFHLVQLHQNAGEKKQ